MIAITINGRLTADPQLSEAGCCNFTVAANNSKMIDGSPQTIFFDVTVWGKRGETMARLLHKGDGVCVTGELWTNPWKDRNGADRISHKINAAQVDFTGKAGGAPKNNSDDDDDKEIFG